MLEQDGQITILGLLLLISVIGGLYMIVGHFLKKWWDVDIQ